jgi:hypothetical protein
MAHLRRMTYTKPIPAGAEIVSHKGKLHARYKGDDDRQILAPLTRKGDRIRLRSEKWYGVYRDANDAVQTVPLSADKTAAQQMLAELVLKVERVRAGLADPKAEAHRKTPLAEHLADWERSLLADGSTAKHVRQTVACVRRLLKDCQFVFISDLSASRVQQFLADLRRPRSAALSPDPGKEWYTRKELATLLGVKPSAIPPAVRQHRLAAQGKGKARRYPRATAEALSALRSRGQHQDEQPVPRCRQGLLRLAGAGPPHRRESPGPP